MLIVYCKSALGDAVLAIFPSLYTGLLLPQYWSAITTVPVCYYHNTGLYYCYYHNTGLLLPQYWSAITIRGESKIFIPSNTFISATT